MIKSDSWSLRCILQTVEHDTVAYEIILILVCALDRISIVPKDQNTQGNDKRQRKTNNQYYY